MAETNQQATAESPDLHQTSQMESQERSDEYHQAQAGSDEGNESQQPGRHSIINMTDALDAGSAIAQQQSMRKIQEKIKTLNRTTYQPDKDPQFFLFLNRLADAEEFKKTDRIDGRRALNDFIVRQDSIMYVKGVKKADQVKKQHQEQLREKGQWKENGDDDPFTNLKQTFTNMVDGKQTQEAIKPRMIDPKAVGKDVIRAKNIIQPKPTINRGPQSPSSDPITVADGTETAGQGATQGLASNVEKIMNSPETLMRLPKNEADPVETLSRDFIPAQSPQMTTSQQEEKGKHILLKLGLTGSGVQEGEGTLPGSKDQIAQGMLNLAKTGALEARQGLQVSQIGEASHQDNEGSKAHLSHQSQKQLGISTLQLDHDASKPHLSASKRGTNMSLSQSKSKTRLVNQSGSPQKKKWNLSRQNQSLIAQIPIPAMDREKARVFHIKSTLNLSERSPLISQAEANSTRNMYARMPTIFVKRNHSMAAEDGGDLESQPSMLFIDKDGSQAGNDLGLALSSQVSHHRDHLASIEQLVLEGGSAAYQLYQQQSEKMLRERLQDQNDGVFMANQESFRLAKNESVNRIVMPRNYTHEKTITPRLPQALNETALEREIKKIVERQGATLENSKTQRQITVAGYEDMKVRLSPRHARLTNHEGHSYLRGLVDSKLNLMQRLENQVRLNDDTQRAKEIKQDSFGLGMSYIKSRKQSVQPNPSGPMIGSTVRALSPIQQTLEEQSQNASKLGRGKENESWLDPRFVVVFAKDGETLGSCKSFKMNIEELLTKYKIGKPAYMKHVTVQHRALKAQFEKRAYKELLEFCADHLLGQKHEVDASRRQQFKTLYTLDGVMLETLDEVRQYCEDPLFVHQKKHVILNDPLIGATDEDLARADSSAAQGADQIKKNVQNKASFIFNPLQNDLIQRAQDKETFVETLDGGFNASQSGQKLDVSLKYLPNAPTIPRDHYPSVSSHLTLKKEGKGEGYNSARSSVRSQDQDGKPKNSSKIDQAQASQHASFTTPKPQKHGSIESPIFGNKLRLNQSSTINMLHHMSPSQNSALGYQTEAINRVSQNESEMQHLRETSIRVERQKQENPKPLPKILLLSQVKGQFKGLTIPQEDDQDLDRRNNAKKIKQQLNTIEQQKGGELYLEWLERNQESVSHANKKMALNLVSNDRALKYSNDAYRQQLRNSLSQRRYTTGGSLQPPDAKPAVVKQPSKFAGIVETGDDSRADMTLPKIGGRHFSLQQSSITMPASNSPYQANQPSLPTLEFSMASQLQKDNFKEGRWRSRAILQALDNVKRSEMFENLRKASESNTISRKMAILNSSPNSHAAAAQRNAGGPLSQRLPAMALTAEQHSGLSLMGADPMKPPTLKQLRMEQIQRQIIEKTNAGIPVGQQPIDASNIIMRVQKCTFQSAPGHGGSSSMASHGKGNGGARVGAGHESNQQKNLTYDEVKSLSDEYLLPCKNIYELHAEFNSLVLTAQQERKAQDLELGEGTTRGQPPVSDKSGIPVDFFLRTNGLLKDKQLDIQHAILQALGIHTNTKSQVSITWTQFLKISTTLAYHCATKAQYIDFWMRFINPGNVQEVSQAEFERLLELLARGTFTDKETLISVQYARGMYQMLAGLSCVSAEEKSLGSIKTAKVRKRLTTELLHVEYFNQTLKKECEFLLDEDLVAQGEIKLRELFPKEKNKTSSLTVASVTYANRKDSKVDTRT